MRTHQRLSTKSVMRSGALLSLLLLLAGTWCGTIQAVEKSRPNILLIVSEDNGPELGCYGDPYVRTPVLDKLAAEGVRFQNAYVAQAGCSPSRATILTGLYPHQNGQLGLATWKFRMFREDTPNLVASLKNSGYRTGILGKLHVNPESAFPFDVKELSSANFARKRLGDYAKRAEAFFDADSKPFFLMVNYPDAHRPFRRQVGGLPEQPLTASDVKPLAYFGLDTPELREQTADYYNSLSRLDALVGDLLAALQRSGKANETLVVYLGDHGADLLRGKRTSCEGGLRIPLIMRWPGRIASQICDKLVSTIDLTPTLLDATQATQPTGLPGASLLPLVRGKAGSWRTHLFTEFHVHSAHNFYPQRTVRNARYKLVCNLLPRQTNPGYDYTLNEFFPSLPPAIDRAPSPIRAAYHRMRSPPEFELYDLETDPYEFHNLVDTDLSAHAEHRAALAELKAQLVAWRNETNDPLLDSDSLKRLKAEIDACFVDGAPDQSKLMLTYPEYFQTATSKAGHLRPNVLFVALDDMNDWIKLLDPAAPIRTPNMERLAKRGMLFTRAYCASPACNPSRVALMTGKSPSSTGVHDNRDPWRKKLPDAVTLTQYFMANGYRALGAGKIFHHGKGDSFHDDASFHEFLKMPEPPDSPMPPSKRNKLPDFGTANTDWGAWPAKEADAIDVRSVNWCIEQLKQSDREESLFLACGLFRPHMPFFVPQHWLDSYPSSSTVMPVIQSDDLDDIPEAGRKLHAADAGRFFRGMMAAEKQRPGSWREAVRCYQAAATFADGQVGRLLDALDASPLAENTVIVLWSDHGYQLGEKDSWEKFTLWEKGTRVPLIVVAPGVVKPGTQCDRPVSLLDLYPTLVELCGLPPKRDVEGHSLTPLLKNPDATWDRPAVMTFKKGNHAVRNDRWRYIRYADGSEELYDHENDPHEWRNLAGDAKFANVKKELANSIPVIEK